MRSTLIRTIDGADIVIPNSILTTKEVLNWSYRDFTGCIQVGVRVAYENDPILVTETLLNAAYTGPAILHEPSPKVIFSRFGNNFLEFELWVWVQRVDEGSSTSRAG